MHLDMKKLVVLVVALLIVTYFALGCDQAYAQDSVPLADPEIMLPIDTTPRTGLNSFPPFADLRGGIATSFSPSAVAPWATLEGNAPITLGSDNKATPDKDESKTYFRAFARIHLGLRVDEAEPENSDVDISDPGAWKKIEALAGIETVVGKAEWEGGYEVLTSLFVAAGGSTPLNADAEVDPRVARIVVAGFRIREMKSGADFLAGLGTDDAAKPSNPALGADGNPLPSLQVIIKTSLPIPKTGGTAWFSGESSIDFRSGQGRVEVGIGISPSAILRKLGKK